MANVLIVINDGPYGTERAYNGLRLAASLAHREGGSVRVFLIGDGAACARRGQKVPQGYYNVEHLLQATTRRKGQVGVCATCMDARGLAETDLVDGCHKGSLEELTSWTLEADKVLSF